MFLNFRIKEKEVKVQPKVCPVPSSNDVINPFTDQTPKSQEYCQDNVGKDSDSESISNVVSSLDCLKKNKRVKTFEESSTSFIKQKDDETLSEYKIHNSIEKLSKHFTGIQSDHEKVKRPPKRRRLNSESSTSSPNLKNKKRNIFMLRTRSKNTSHGRLAFDNQAAESVNTNNAVQQTNSSNNICQWKLETGFECGKWFSKTYNLKVHQLVHNDVKPFKCPNCTHSFKQLAHLNRHSKTHPPKNGSYFTCTVCSVSFSKLSDLTKHNKALHLSQETNESLSQQNKQTFEHTLSEHLVLNEKIVSEAASKEKKDTELEVPNHETNQNRENLIADLPSLSRETWFSSLFKGRQAEVQNSKSDATYSFQQKSIDLPPDENINFAPPRTTTKIEMTEQDKLTNAMKNQTSLEHYSKLKIEEEINMILKMTNQSNFILTNHDLEHVKSNIKVHGDDETFQRKAMNISQQSQSLPHSGKSNSIMKINRTPVVAVSKEDNKNWQPCNKCFYFFSNSNSLKLHSLKCSQSEPKAGSNNNDMGGNLKTTKIEETHSSEVIRLIYGDDALPSIQAAEKKKESAQINDNGFVNCLMKTNGLTFNEGAEKEVIGKEEKFSGPKSLKMQPKSVQEVSKIAAKNSMNCEICGQIFTDENQLIDHIYAAHVL